MPSPTRLPGEQPCKGCGKPVIFVRDDQGKTQILDARAPVYSLASFTEYEGKNANVDGVAAVAAIHTVSRDRIAFVTHFATCAKANAFSASNKSKSGGA